jgi:large subunit ribosomal protein L15e
MMIAWVAACNINDNGGHKMGLYKYIREAWKSPKSGILKDNRQRIIEWKKQESTSRILRPTNLAKARSLGYRAKQGIILVRQRVLRGGRKKPFVKKGRRTKRQSQRLNLNLSYQTVAEQRVSCKYPNCEILNSYYVGQDGKYYWYEVILVDIMHPAIKNDSKLKWITMPKHTDRVHRGLTSSGKKSRALRHKGKGAEKARPSQKAHGNRLK